MKTCPRCRSPVTAGDYEGVTLETCERCHGQWLGPEQLKEIIDTHAKAWRTEDLQTRRPPGLRGVPMAQLREDLPCPNCGRTMAAFNYGGDTGIILDKCSECGGLWLDGGELEKVQTAVEASDQDLDTDVKRFSASLREVEAREDALEQADTRAIQSPFIAAIANRIVDLE